MSLEEDIWTYRVDTGLGTDADLDLTGYAVEALDGPIGTIERGRSDLDRRYLVVDIGGWLLGKKVLLPAGVVQRIDTDGETVFVDRNKAEIERAPEYDEDAYDAQTDRHAFGSYYGPGGAGWRPGW